ncbi:molybdopterin cofactor-binding domain-containing protein [Mycobacterium sp. KBS0706]|uniref:xanthine dehydrogenase family protein molybdopterin-binding subunit n=1 Tax=Mycobacterium sp. KBS0706 TaxID=2578109 RepID=UPI001C8F989A|nr:molybdopterin cofactor-binding domain-containing protein [Mycobacterium sp. KBS0706]
MSAGLSRRSMLQGAGGLVVSFALAPAARAQQAAPQPALPGSLEDAPFLDSWIRIDPKGAVTVFTGKAELGQGIATALQQIAAEELGLSFETPTIVTADTGRTPNEGYTAGSHSMQDSGTAIRNAAAQMREILLAEAARQMGIPADQLQLEAGNVVAPDGNRRSYGALAAGLSLHVQAQPESRLTDPAAFRVMGKPLPRIDIPAKVTGGEAYVQDLRLPGMLHGRIVRPPSYGARLAALDLGAAEALPGVVKVVRDGNFLAVVAEQEFQAVKAMRLLAAAAQWQEDSTLPDQARLPEALLALPAKDFPILERYGATPSTPGRTLEASYSRPYLLHGSIGPSCAVAQQEADGLLTVWTHTQGVYPDRKAIAEMLGRPIEQVRCIHVPGSGCYGHNGADDAAADAALLAAALPGRAVRVQWMREQEHAWEPFGPAMVAQARATLDQAGRIADWDYGVWSNTHSMRPGPAGSLLAARHLAKPFPVPAPRPLPQPEGGGDRNAIPLYTLPSARVVHHFLPDMPLRISALRSLGAQMNVFAIESFMDELALAAGADPVEFRLKHLDDPRARDVIAAAAEAFGWAQGAQGKPAAPGHGRGFAFARYKNLAAYCAVAVEVAVERETGQVRVPRIVAAVDTGQVVNPDGVRNQIEGAVLQSMSWTLYESVGFDQARITSVDWSTYPILRFDAVPDSVEVRIVDRPGAPFLGCGETGQGPASAALANGIADAAGQRLRDLPLTAARIKAAIGV